MKNLLFFAVVLVGCLLAYNYYYGSENEKTQSEEIISELEDVGRSLKTLVMEEKEKFDQGKYDDLLDKLKNTVNRGIDAVKQGEESSQKELDDIRSRIKKLDKKFRKMDRKDQEALQAMGQEIQDLIDEAEKAVRDLDKK